VRRRQRGQALIETAVTLPVLLALFVGFLAAGVGAQGYVDLNTAVYLAAASSATAFAGDPQDADQFASDTFLATVAHDPLLASPSLAPCGGYDAGQTVTCTGSATLQFSRTPLAVVVPIDPRITQIGTAVRSPYRSQKP
jgi:Flp pilus assembly protein TadG